MSEESNEKMTSWDRREAFEDEKIKAAKEIADEAGGIKALQLKEKAEADAKHASYVAANDSQVAANADVIRHRAAIEVLALANVEEQKRFHLAAEADWAKRLPLIDREVVAMESIAESLKALLSKA